MGLASLEEGVVPYSKEVQTSSKRGWSFQVIRKINNNTYELDLPPSYNISNSFNVCDLSPLDVGFKNLWMNSLQEGEDDEGVTTPSSMENLSRRITRSMTKREAFPSLSLFSISLVLFLLS